MSAYSSKPRGAVHAHCGWAIVVPVAISTLFATVTMPACGAAPAGEPPVSYRRVLVPADSVQAWPRDGKKYLPVESADFEEWIAAGNAESADARIAEAAYFARLVGDRLVDGHAEWQIGARSDEPAFVPLPGMAIVVESPRWHDRAAPVRLGLWQRGEEPPAYGLQVADAGTVEFSWHSMASHDSLPAIEIPLGLPPSTIKQLVLDLPAGKRPVLEGAVLLGTEDVGPPASDTAEPQQLWRRWKLALKASATSRLRIEDELDQSALRPSASSHEEVVYRVTNRGLDVEITLRLSGLAPEVRDLGIDLPSGLSLVAASSDGRNLAWRAEGQDGAMRVVVQTLRPADDGSLVLRLSGWAPLVLDRRWTLPKIDAEGTYWISSSIQVVIDPGLELRAVTPLDAIQTGIEQTQSDGGTAETLTFQSYAPSAGVELVVGHRRPVVRARSGTTLQGSDEPVRPQKKPAGAAVGRSSGRAHDPKRSRDGDRPATAIQTARKSGALHTVVARRVVIESLYTAHNAAAHRVTYELDNLGAASIKLRMPAGAQIDSMWVGQELMRWAAGGHSHETVIVRLPHDKRFPVVSVYFHTPAQPLARLDPPLPASDVPLLAGRWIVWLPHDFAVVGLAGPTGLESFDWRSRLFGPLGSKERGVGSKADSPLAARISFDLERGWRAWNTTFVGNRPQTIVVTQPSTTTAWALSLLLVGAVGGTWLVERQRCFVWGTAVAAALCLLLPVVYAPLATGALWGLIASLVTGTLRRPSAVNDALTATLSPLTRMLIVFGIMLFRADNTAAQSPDAPPSPPAQSADSTIHRVLVPVDKQGQAAGTKVYVSDEFLGLLLRRVNLRQSRGDRWLLREALVEGELSERPEQAELGAGTWVLTLDLEVFARDSDVELPLVQEQSHRAKSAMLDGISVPLAWKDDGRGVIFRVAEPGTHRLELSLQPVAREADGRRQVELTVPPLRGARFKLTYPAALTDWNVTGAVAAIQQNAAAGKFIGELDGTGSLGVSWPVKPDDANADASAAMAELRWLSVTPGGVELAVKYVPARGAELPRVLTIVADRRWEMTDAGTAAVVTDAPSGGAQAIRVESHNETTDDGYASNRALSNRQGNGILLRFRLRGGISLGRLRLPPLRLTSPTVDQHWLAVSTDPSLETELLTSGAATAIQSEVFVSLWGDNLPGNAPQLAWSEAANDADQWGFAVHPRAVESTVVEALHVAVGRSGLRLEYQVDVEPQGAERYGLSLEVPAGLSLDAVTAIQSERELPLRWTRPSDRRVNVFFARPAAEPYRLAVAGRLAIGERRCAIPHVVWVDRPAGTVRTLIYREEDALVETRGENLAAAPGDSIDVPPAAWSARHVATYDLDTLAAADARMEISPNDVAVDGQSLVALAHKSGAWQATFAATGRVTSGQLGVVRIAAPASWRGPFDVQPTALNANEVNPDAGRARVITLRLPETLEAGKRFEFQIRGQLSTATGKPIEVPEITIIGPASWRRYITVPAELDGQPADWTARGVENEEVPEGLRTVEIAQPARVFRATAEPFRVSLEPRQASPLASVPLVEIRALAGPDGGQCAATRFILVPQGLAECVMEIAVPWDLIRVSVAGHPVPAESLGNRRWKVSLASSSLPQAIDIITQREGDRWSHGNAVTVTRPTLLAGNRPIPIELSLWMLGDEQTQSRPTIHGGKLVTALQLAGWRIERLVSVAEAATSIDTQAPPLQYSRWLRAWTDVVATARREAVSAREQAGRHAESVRLSPTADEQLAMGVARATTWLETAGRDSPRTEGEGKPVEPANSAAQFAAADAARWTYCSADGETDQVTIASAAFATPSIGRAAGLAVIGGLALVLTWLVRIPVIQDLWWRWPHAVGLLGGLAAWAWLRPSWLGLVVAAVFLVLVVRPVWPGPTFRPEESTVVQRTPQP